MAVNIKMHKSMGLTALLVLGISLLISFTLLPHVALAEECGKGDQQVTLGVPIGCLGDEGDIENPIYDMLRAIIRFLSAGVGIVIVLMIVISGIQYITSSGNPEATQGAKKRLGNAVIALLLFIFMAAILNFLVPGGLL